jgi:glycerol-3-phosphate acyltransferase PlsY
LGWIKSVNGVTVAEIILWVVFSFLCGSIPWSVWLGKIFLRKDVRQYGDGNPGTTNVFRAGSKWLGVLTLMLDISKAAAPVGFAYHNLGIHGFSMVLIALMPVLGHAFSPFLAFKGGKAVASAFGVWIGLTIWKASLPAVIFALIGLGVFEIAGWAVMLALASILITLLVWLPEPLFLSVLLGEIIILAWTHRADLCQPLRFRSSVRKFFQRSGR